MGVIYCKHHLANGISIPAVVMFEGESLCMACFNLIVGGDEDEGSGGNEVDPDSPDE